MTWTSIDLAFIILLRQNKYYFDESITGKKVRDSSISILKHVYGDNLTILNSLDEIGEDERDILLQLSDSYVK